MRTRIIATAAALALAALMTIVPSAGAAPAVRFTGIYYDSPGTDTGSNSSLNHEWVRVHNSSGKARVLTGWTIRDTARHIFRFPKFKLGAHASVRVHTGKGKDSKTDLYWGRGWYVWNNDGDTAKLKNRSGSRIDRCHYSGVGSFTGC